MMPVPSGKMLSFIKRGENPPREKNLSNKKVLYANHKL